MFRFLNKKRGQSTLEYAILIVIVIGALIAIQVYIKRGIQGRLKSATDDIGDQYSPGNTNISITTTTVSKTRDTFGAGTPAGGVGVSKSVMEEDETITTNGSMNIINVEQEFWGIY